MMDREQLKIEKRKAELRFRSLECEENILKKQEEIQLYEKNMAELGSGSGSGFFRGPFLLLNALN